jgi:Prohead core protein serine protease
MSKKILIDTSGAPIRMHLTESADGKMVAQGEFGRCDVPTENRRIYPRAIWEREIRKIQQAISEGKVLGELDHPCFISDKFSVLTSEGWKDFRDVKVGDKVWSRVNGQAVLSSVDGIVDERYSGPAIAVKGRSIDSTFTPKHKMLLSKRPDRSTSNEFYATLEEICENPGKYSHHAIPKTAKFPQKGTTKVIIPGVPTKSVNRSNNDTTQDLVLDAGLFSAFMGLYLSEGSLSSESTDTYGINISQKSAWSRNFIFEEVLSQFPKELKWTTNKDGFFLSDARLYAYLRPLGDAYTKYVPNEVRNLDPEYLNELIFWYAIGDGRMMSSSMETEEKTHKERLCEALREGHVPSSRTEVFTFSERLIKGLHECLVKSGRSGVISKIETKNDYEFAGHVIKAENKVPLYQLHISTTDNIWLDPRNISYSLVQHDGNIFCLQVTHGNFYVQQNGKSFWTGNSDGKTSLKRVSHIITHIEMTEDGKIIGTARIADNEHGRQLKSILDAGGSVGVSSRGMGSTAMNEDGYEVVQEDYCYMTHDFVADPAVKTSYPEFHSESVEMKKKKVVSEISSASSNVAEDKAAEAKAREEVNAAKPEQEPSVVKDAEEEVEEQKEENLSPVSENPEISKEPNVKAEEKVMETEQQVKVSEQAEQEPTKNLAAQIALEDIAKTLRPFILPESIQEAVQIKEKEIEELKKLIEAKDQEIASAKEQALKLGEAARKSLMLLHFERAVSESSERQAIRKIVGDPRRFDKHQELIEAIDAAKKVIAAVTEDKVGIEKKAKEITESFERRLNESEKRAQKLEASLKEATSLARSYGLRAYVLERVKNNPNAPKILKLTESVATKEEADRLIEKFSVVAAPSKEYNSIRQRFQRLANSSLVEEHLKETGHKAAQDTSSGSVVEGVEAEMIGLFPGSDLEQVRGLAGN